MSPELGVRLTVSNSTVIPSLLAALHDGGCVADHAGPDSLDVLFPWLVGVEDAEQVVIELAFFLRSWKVEHPGVTVDSAFERAYRAEPLGGGAG